MLREAHYGIIYLECNFDTLATRIIEAEKK